MTEGTLPRRESGSIALKSLVFLMFAMFAMTTDSVGTVIPEVIREFRLGLTAGGSFQYATMSGIGIAAILLGFLADWIGRKVTILLGLCLFGISSGLFAAGHAFLFFVSLLFVSGLGIGIFKAGALALIGDLSRSTHEHASTMNLVEGFFGVGAIVGPAVVTFAVNHGASWKWVYLVAAILCLLLVAGTAILGFPVPAARQTVARPSEALRLAGDPAALFFGAALMLYVGAEAAIYVWAPTYLAGYRGPWALIAGYAVAIFFILRAAGRFLGAWLLSRWNWSTVLAVCSCAMAILFWCAVLGGRAAAVFALPSTGLFMSVLYPTINSTGISCHEKGRHGSIAGLLLFLTCVSAVASPLLMGAIGDWFGDIAFSIVVGAALASLLAMLCLWNLVRSPFAIRLAARNFDDYGTVVGISDAAKS